MLILSHHAYFNLSLSFFSFVSISSFLKNIRNLVSKYYLKNGQEGYACYRIPAIIHFQNKKLLAFAEGRVDGCNDFGNVDIVMKYSDDGGLNWSKQQILINNQSLQVGNPAPVVDHHDPLFPQVEFFYFLIRYPIRARD